MDLAEPSSPERDEPSPAVELFIMAVQKHSDTPAEVAAKLLAVKKADEAQRGGPLKGISEITSCWAHCLKAREAQSGDASNVCVELLRELTDCHHPSNVAVLLDGFARAACSVSAEAAEAAAVVLVRDLSRERGGNGPLLDDEKNLRLLAAWVHRRAAVWVDIARRFRLRCVDCSLWMQVLDAAIADNRWGVAAELSSAVGADAYCLKRLLGTPSHHWGEMAGVVPKFSPQFQVEAFKQLMDLGFPYVADSVRHACSLGPRPAELSTRLQTRLLEHLGECGLQIRAAELAASAGCSKHRYASSALSEESVEESVEVNQSKRKVFSVDTSAIRLVDSESGLASFIDAVKSAEGLCGLDTEWSPGEDLVSILQVSLGLNVWILDLQWARQTQQEQAGIAVADLFQSPAVTKLGFCFQQDLNRLPHSLPMCCKLTWALSPYVELQMEGRSLANMMQAEVGLVLDKAHQCSAWAVRPLSAEQLRYAAADAICLAHLFKVLEDKVAAGKLLPQAWKKPPPSQVVPALTADHVREAAQSLGLAARFEPYSNEHPLEEGNVVCFVLKPDRRPVAVVTRRSCKISLEALASGVGVSKGRISMASSAECLQLFGFYPGSLPPVGLHQGVETLLHVGLRACPGEICFSSGSSEVNLICTCEALENVFHPCRWLHEELHPRMSLATRVCRMAAGHMPLRFVCVDPALSRLLQRLRILDLDVVSVVEGPPQKSRVKKSKQIDEVSRLQQLDTILWSDWRSQVVILTRSRRAAEFRRDEAYRLQGTSLQEQFCEILAVFGVNGTQRLETSLDKRCHLCNAGLECVDREQVVQRHFKTAEVRDNYFLCTDTNCEMKFWHSKTYHEMRRDVRRLVQNAWF